MGTVALLREFKVEERRVRETLSFGRGRRPKQFTEEGSYYLRYFCPTRNKRVHEHVGYDFNEALRLRDIKSQYLKKYEAALTCGLNHLDVQPSNSRVRIEDAIALYFKNLSSQGKDLKTIRSYRFSVTCFQKSCSKTYIDELNRQDLFDFMGWLRNQPRKPRRNSNPERTYCNKIANVVIFLKAFGKEKLLKKSEYPPYSERPVIYLLDEQLDRLFSHTVDEDEVFLLNFFLKLGVRDGEAFNAEYTDVFDGHFHVQQKSFWHPKKYHCRAILIPADLLSAIEERRRRTKERFIFPNSVGKPNQHLLRRVQAIAKRAGFHVDLHTCRRTYATKLLKKMDIPDIQMLLGHKDNATTMRYLGHMRLKSRAFKEAIEAALCDIGQNRRVP